MQITNLPWQPGYLWVQSKDKKLATETTASEGREQRQSHAASIGGEA